MSTVTATKKEVVDFIVQYHLELSEHEAALLCEVLGNVAGPPSPARVHASALFLLLECDVEDYIENLYSAGKLTIEGEMTIETRLGITLKEPSTTVVRHETTTTTTQQKGKVVTYTITLSEESALVIASILGMVRGSAEDNKPNSYISRLLLQLEQLLDRKKFERFKSCEVVRSSTLFIEGNV